MAGIGFELLKLWKQGSYLGLMRAYSLTAMMGSGPGLLIILSLSVVCFFSFFQIPTPLTGYQFLSIISYLLATSIIVSSFLQYTFFRYTADMVFSEDFNHITSNYIGVLLVQLVFGISISTPVVLYLFAHYSLYIKMLLISNFNILCLIWVSIVLLTGLKAYKFIIWGFVVGYMCMIIMHILFVNNEITSLLFEFLTAQVILFLYLLYAILDYYPTKIAIEFEFLKKENLYYSLVFSNFFYAMGFWIDKLLFWFNADTGYWIFPPLRLSPVYDLPIFIAYFSIIPAMAVFLFNIEARFSFIYPEYMQTIFQRKTFSEINAIRNELVVSGRKAVLSLIRTQAAVVIILFLAANFIFSVLHILPIQLNLLFILLVAVGLNVILWGIINLLYYMTQYRHALIVNLIFFLGNFTLTFISLRMGPNFYGYGLGFSLLFAVAIGLYFLNEDFNALEYETFMMTD